MENEDPEAPPWKDTNYKLDVIANELGIDFREEYIRMKFPDAEIESIRGNKVVVLVDDYVPGRFLNGAFEDFAEVTGIKNAGGMQIEVTFKIE